MSPLGTLVLAMIIAVAIVYLMHSTYQKSETKHENYLYNPMTLAYTTDN